MIFCGVFDGHGPWGHLVAKRVRELMPSSLLCNWQKALAYNMDNIGLDDDRQYCQLDVWKQSHIKTCSAVDQELEQQADSFYSGTTSLTVVKQVKAVLLNLNRLRFFAYMLSLTTDGDVANLTVIYVLRIQ